MDIPKYYASFVDTLGKVCCIEGCALSGMKLGHSKVSLTKRCPYFRSVLVKRGSTVVNTMALHNLVSRPHPPRHFWMGWVGPGYEARRYTARRIL